MLWGVANKIHLHPIYIRLATYNDGLPNIRGGLSASKLFTFLTII